MYYLRQNFGECRWIHFYGVSLNDFTPHNTIASQRDIVRWILVARLIRSRPAQAGSDVITVADDETMLQIAGFSRNLCHRWSKTHAAVTMKTAAFRQINISYLLKQTSVYCAICSTIDWWSLFATNIEQEAEETKFLKAVVYKTQTTKHRNATITTIIRADDN